MSVWEAKAYCENLHGMLFQDLDGTQAQLDWLIERMGDMWVWLGVYTEDHKVWKKFSGGKVISWDKLLWRQNQPNNKGGSQFYTTCGGPAGGKLEDMEHWKQFYSVCLIV